MFQELGWKRYETLQHSKRVAGYTRILGQRRGIAQRELTRLEVGALLHDIGKIAVPRNVLLKPGPLNREEWRVMKIHPSIGFQLLAEFPQMGREAEIVYNHHEAYNGSGYPRGLSGKEIPLGARLFSIVDSFDAMTSDRPYRRARSMGKARQEIARARGEQFDPELVDLFLSVPVAELEAIRSRTPDPPAGNETETGV
jgi:HD-GYP domain-containing protein (c-di-GMP phosphodiesterase class II)